MDGVHDLGGMDGFGPVVPDGAVFHAAWQRRLFALTLVSDGLELTAGHFREAIESMPPAEYLAASYFERWLYGLERRLELAGTLTQEDVEAELRRLGGGQVSERRDPGLAESARAEQSEGGALPAATAPRFRPGQRVRVSRMRPAGHTRCPRYVRGAAGVIERVHGDDLLPEADARDREEPVEAVYAVRFRSDDLFGPGEEPPHDVHVDLWESYLAKA